MTMTVISTIPIDTFEFELSVSLQSNSLQIKPAFSHLVHPGFGLPCLKSWAAIQIASFKVALHFE